MAEFLLLLWSADATPATPTSHSPARLDHNSHDRGLIELTACQTVLLSPSHLPIRSGGSPSVFRGCWINTLPADRTFGPPAMSSSLPGPRPLPASRYDLTTYWGRVRHSADIADMR